jgi:nitrite reductase/ring-hydroxylating ferredoxin subunit
MSKHPHKVLKSVFKNALILLYFGLLSQGCQDGNNYDENCNFLLNVGVNISLNLNLSQYNQLNFPSNPVYVPNEGNAGIIVNNTGTGYVAFDAADPNHELSSCSRLSITGLEGVSGCDQTHRYSLLTGQPLQNPNLRCSLKPYRVERSGNVLYVTN